MLTAMLTSLYQALRKQLNTDRFNLLVFRHWSAIFGLAPAINQTDDALEWDGILMAAPKKRTTRSKKRLRMTHKWPKNKRGIDVCFYCGRPKLMHFLCKHCLEETLKETDKIRKKMFHLKY